MKRYVGERFGRLVLKKHITGSIWIVKCDCGTTKEIKHINNLVRKGTNSCGCIKNEKQRLKLLNQTFGNLKCLEFAYIKDGLTYWKFLCLCCNNEYICRGRSVTRKTRPVTQCRRCSYNGRDSNFCGVGEIGGTYLYNIKKGAQTRNLEFNITTEYLWSLFLKQEKKCALTGLKITLDKNYRKNNGQTASLDRIDSSKGYIENNVQWVHKDVNKMKMDFDEKYFKYICNLISDKDNKSQ